MGWYSYNNIKAQEYKACGSSYTPVARLRFYYLRITDNSCHSPKELTRILRAICKAFKAEYIGVKSKGHGVQSFRKPHIHVILTAGKPISLKELYKHIPAGFNAKLWRIKLFSDLADCIKYIKEHEANKAKRGFLYDLEIIALRGLRVSLSYMKGLIKLIKLQAPLLIKSLKEVILWKESRG